MSCFFGAIEIKGICGGLSVKVNMYKLHQKFIKEWWHIIAVTYGKWLQKTSKLKTKELSEQEW